MLLRVIGLARSIYIRCINGNFGREFTYMLTRVHDKLITRELRRGN